MQRVYLKTQVTKQYINTFKVTTTKVKLSAVSSFADTRTVIVVSKHSSSLLN